MDEASCLRAQESPKNVSIVQSMVLEIMRGQKDRQTLSQTNGQTDTQSDRQTDRQAGTYTDIQERLVSDRGHARRFANRSANNSGKRRL